MSRAGPDDYIVDFFWMYVCWFCCIDLCAQVRGYFMLGMLVLCILVCVRMLRVVWCVCKIVMWHQSRNPAPILHQTRSKSQQSSAKSCKILLTKMCIFFACHMIMQYNSTQSLDGKKSGNDLIILRRHQPKKTRQFYVFFFVIWKCFRKTCARFRFKVGGWENTAQHVSKIRHNTSAKSRKFNWNPPKSSILLFNTHSTAAKCFKKNPAARIAASKNPAAISKNPAAILYQSCSNPSAKPCSNPSAKPCSNPSAKPSAILHSCSKSSGEIVPVEISKQEQNKTKKKNPKKGNQL